MNAKSPHFWWIISIMVATIIALTSFILSERICNATKIMEFISYSSAILSITLSIFAIQYTYTSNVQIQQQFEKINAVAESIKNASGELNTTSSKLDENLNIILERLEEIDQGQKEMSSQLNNMNSKVQETSQTNYLVSK
ncbi:hypothetical protein [Paraprevotella clara]|uniref:hypothetical protein n=1 Tax=Paraprevotella clara TaxID=454154 RepID=UPI0040259DA9